MSRLVIAILILFAVLVGLKSANSSLFRLSFPNQNDSLAPATRNTGFSAESTTASNGGVTQENSNAPGRVSADTSPLPPQTQPAVPANW
ncbi:MAG: hypothetical protein KME45_05230 [Stenomitos rutilans HA7619-LM2]|nr:hypothetical protein [Stenomitos rutilans HA7619-LM2]